MNDKEREEIEKVASVIANHLKQSNHMVDYDMTLRITYEWILDDFIPFVGNTILTQVAKAKREAIEECAICAEDTKFLETCSERIVALVQLRHRIAEAIRRRLYD